MLLKKYIRKNIYRWHRMTGMIIALPILLWTVSGFLHPVMSSFRPQVNNSFIPSASIDTGRICISLKDALIKNHISQLHRFRIVEMEHEYYYQVQLPGTDTLSYLSAFTGNLLKDGDSQYAAWLAFHMLNDPAAKDQQDLHSHNAAQIGSVLLTPSGTTGKATVKDVQPVTRFTDEYRSSNVLLPVYRVSFHRADGIRLYIETSTGRLASAMDNRKAGFTKFFAVTHSWSFLEGWGAAKNIFTGCIAALCFLSSLFGFYIYNFSKSRKPIKRTASRQRRHHRTLGNIFVVTTLLFAFSGAWHSFHKLKGPGEGIQVHATSLFKTSCLDLPLTRIINNLPEQTQLTNVSVVEMNGRTYWQLFVKRGKTNWMLYRDKETFQWLEDGDTKYGCYLACRFSGSPIHKIAQSNCLKAFTNRYSMMNKRLPVVEVGFTNEKNFYVETSTGYLSAVTDKGDQAERFSFSNLHMQHFWEDWLGKEAGKPVRNVVLTSSTLGLLLLAFTGTAIYISRKRKKRSMQANA